MKILYLILLYNGDINGGHTFRMATAKALANIVGEENLDIILSELDTSDWEGNIVMRMRNYSSKKEKIKNLMEGNITQRSNRDIKDIVEIINRNKYDLVLFGSSETGKLMLEVKKKCHVKTMTWYHDIVADVIEKKNKFNVKMYPVWHAEKNAERIDAELTDIPVVLHQRDADLLYKYWNRKADVLIPIGLEDKYKPNKIKSISDATEPLKLLFVGAYNWSVNIEAIKWFCENVMSNLYDENVMLIIVGFQMEKLVEDEWINLYRNVKVIGTVDDLGDIYSCTDVVVEPIWTGSGMKVKTAEALMYGKEIIGTEEALIGYDELHECICYSANDFIKKIKLYCYNKPLRFNQERRTAYEINYSLEGMENKIRKVLMSLNTLK